MPASRPRPSRPNVLLIIADQWRGDCLGFDGHPVVETPHLDHLFYHGVHFRQAYASTPTCVPARASLMTGLSPRAHGRVGYDDTIPWDYPDTLPSRFTAAGYHTCCVGKLHVAPNRNRIGFQEVILHDGLPARSRPGGGFDLPDDYRRFLRSQAPGNACLEDTGLHVNSWVVNPWPYEERLHPTSWAVSEAVEFLGRRDPTAPFFLNLSLVRPHPPFDPPAKYLDFYRDKPLPPPPIGRWRESDRLGRGGLNCEWTRGPVAPAQLDRARRAYYALITQVDLQLNRLFMALEEHRLHENTVVMFVSDHGEMLGDHHFHAKALPFDGSARVPWLMRFPPAWGIEPRQVVQTPVELRDILPTLCACAGIRPPAGIDGRNVLPLIDGQTRRWNRRVEGEHMRINGESTQWLTDGRVKYIWFTQTGRELLFDLQKDPQELADLSASHPRLLAQWRARLIRQIGDYEEGFVRKGRLVPGRPAQTTLRFLRRRTGAAATE